MIRFTYALFLILVASLMTQCKKDHKVPALSSPNMPPMDDHHSFAKPEEAVITHLSLDLTADFSNKTLSGTATYGIKVAPGATNIYLDTRDLDIISVAVDDVNAAFTLGDVTEWLGQSLSVPVTSENKKLTIRYATRPGAEALQWLEPSQTAGKNQPYLFTQGQAILTRTWIPIQDSPGIRLTYDAQIKCPPSLLAVMSATNPTVKNAEGLYTFSMKQPIPAYLIALAIGDIDFRAIGERTGVYAEPSIVDKAAAEFSDMEKMVEAAEALYGPYQWERYDVIVLPPSFPFGGMENPKLTFATPTILAGDKSLVALIAHELAHSWSGNLVTNATWNDFWLNEGFTVYFELRIMEALYGKSYAAMLTNLGYQGLTNTIKELPAEDTHLFLKLDGRNPDDGMTDIAYEKGAHFLLLLEEKAGREKFDAFLKSYFTENQFQSMTTTKFLAYLDEKLIQPNHIDINVDEWVYQPGLPANCPVITTDRFAAVEKENADFLNGKEAKSLSTAQWTSHEWLHFIRALPDSLSAAQMKDLDNAFGYTQSGNSEILAAWFTLAIKQGYGKEILPSIRKFLVEVGRRKFLTPLYTSLVESGMKEEAKSIYQEARPNYHSVAYNTIDKIVN